MSEDRKSIINMLESKRNSLQIQLDRDLKDKEKTETAIAWKVRRIDEYVKILEELK